MEDSIPEYQSTKNAHITWIKFLLMCSTPWELLCSHLHSSSSVSCTELFQTPSLSSLLSYLMELAICNVNKVILFSYLHQLWGIKTWKINHEQWFSSSPEALNTITKTHWISRMLKSTPLSGKFSPKTKSHWITQVENYPHGISGIHPLLKIIMMLITMPHKSHDLMVT